MTRPGGSPTRSPAQWTPLAALAAPAALVSQQAVAETAARRDGALAPMTYLTGFGPKADPVVSLTWATLAISIAVIVIMSGLVVAGVMLRRSQTSEPTPVTSGPNGLIWIYVGLALTMIPLAGTMVWTVMALAKVSGPPTAPTVTIEVTGHQWWWEARYLSDEPSRVFTTANEIYIPVGEPVRIRLASADVIHSFWVPSLSGKMQAIPGLTNAMWLEADRPGRYRGQCTQFCGAQHAQMIFYIIAEPKHDFDAWWTTQLQPTPPPQNPQTIAFEQTFVHHCGACHSVRGTDAGGVVAPNLSHLMTRQTLASGLIPNTPGNLSAWIADPQSIKPGTLMPVLYLSGPELHDVSSYLETLN